ncbi:DEAD/DEAH box helicase [Streptococcus pyogenes]|uniref:AAA family ATPase n=1 Tax=Streptococcus pyogenes TaxID=1314 RepID=UPI0010A16E4B|nr:AAA family ATPase [Streptococcus pyogenes]VGV41998.1 Superfamily I DNA and RNA helicases [Streptococcus pyogenes]VGV60937.1 Superfamily I DNA and RNA helicases [Streptococcus pyogenes]VGW10475.1 Superfamily I DNA and RNA helicases [Streptococcus pyogenes]VHC07957.1 Superfamily I DNA and RNA helicases [Streptococcus pyogenes]VHC60628.1 Superfamily I DNA and RNA helicases [Streptococcus pyogenes]
MSDIKFYEKVSQEIESSESYIKFRSFLRTLIEDIEGTTYIIQSPLYNIEGDKSTELRANSVESFVVLIPNTKIIFTSITSIDSDEFQDYTGEFIDSITTLSGVFGFKGKIGNSRKWLHLIEERSISDFSSEFIQLQQVTDRESRAILEILVSLITGSINTPDKGGESKSILDAVRKRIVQFDGDQTRFIYDDISKKEISIQGLAGTGKTELLFHRLVNLYNQTDKKIVFTCNSKILANDIKKRIPKFFDQMKVSKREDIDERIRVMRSWGSHYNPNSGLYSYICSYYGIDFINYTDSGREGFDGVCKDAIEKIGALKDLGEFEYCFDYILIDEAQDFSDSFFKLCEMVVSEQVIIASDIFQTIYDRKSELVQKPDFTLNKVYRTDPKNFMFAQFLGFGLQERPVIKWFEDDEAWKTSGYIFNKSSNDGKIEYEFSREPINRFNDFNDYPIQPTVLKYTNSDAEILSELINILDELRKKHKDITPGDIGIVFISKGNRGYNLADMISSLLEQKFNWESQKIYESRYKSRENDKVFISNQNNVKGLEFSFMIGIVLDEIKQDIESRNTIYMLMTRSFLTSYLILGNSNKIIYDNYNPMLEEIIRTGKAKIIQPEKDEILQEEQIQNLIDGALTFDQKIEKALRNKSLFNSENIQKIRGIVSTLLGNSGVNISDIENIIEQNRVYLND